MSSNRIFISADVLAHSENGIDLAAHLASGQRVSTGHRWADTPRAVPVFSSWPVRLFEVAGCHSDGSLVRGFRVVEEAPSRLILGPHGRQVEAALEAPLPSSAPSGPRVRWQCHDLAVALRAAGLDAAAAVISASFDGAACSAARDAMLAALGSAPSRVRTRERATHALLSA
ncbi:hypothetical protein [Brachybacterium paraconglomeratum]|uniref:hypothetical protein n=1 Tax=Brachybacterium paraconglomeratum TaxID=173362 RepID=UPI0022AE61FD|nr:hypothetical protein [Brachybacterium paraconglomeratum]MCZ4326746.1 hypothetical protein [Brachybacterium paraconglomeratum]